MERITRGFRLLKKSWEVLKADKELIGLAALSIVAGLVVVGVFLLGYVALVGTDADPDGTVEAVLGIPLAFVLTFIAVFTTASIVAAATIRLQGGDPTVRDGVHIAWSRVDRLITWTLLTATVGLVLRAIRQRAGFLGGLVTRLVEMAWEVVTFLVVPVILYEEEGAWGSVKRSATLFRERWGEQLVGNAAIGLAMFLLGIPAFLVVGVIAAAVPLLGILLGVVTVGLLVSTAAALSGIFRAALYQYAVSGEAIGPFTTEDLGGSFKARAGGRRGGFGGGFSGRGL